MISDCSLKRGTVSELIGQVRKDFEEYQTCKNPGLLRDAHACLSQAQQLLNRVLCKTGENEKQRRDAIAAKQKEVDEMRNHLKQFEAR